MRVVYRRGRGPLRIRATLTDTMSEEMKLPMFISLTETKGDSTTRLVDKIRNMILEYDVEESVELRQIKTKSENRTQNQIEYAIVADTNDEKMNSRLFAFLNKINESLYDNFPCLVEPPLGALAQLA